MAQQQNLFGPRVSDEPKVQQQELDLLKSTKLWIADRLEESGQFLVIDPNYKFKDKVLDAQAKRNLYAEKKELSPGDKTNKFLVVVSTDQLTPASLIEEKLNEAYKKGIAMMFVQHKKSPTKAHTESREDFEFFKFDPGYSNQARESYSHEQRRRHIQTNAHERKLNELTSGYVVYFNPSGKLEVIEFRKGVIGDYIYKETKLAGILKGKKLGTIEYKTIMDHSVKSAYPLFTLRRAPGSRLLQAEPIFYDDFSETAHLLAWSSSLEKIGYKRRDMESLNERIDTALENRNDDELARLTKILGKRNLGEYARE